MARLSAEQFDKDREALEMQSLSPIEHLYGVEENDMLDEAVKIGIMTKETRERIDEVFEGHLKLFRETFRRKGVSYVNEDAGRKAFVRAFETVYGRFILEDEEREGAEGGLDKDSIGQVRMFLGKVLRISIDEKSGFKGRSELQAAIRRLRMLGAGKNVKNIIGNELPELERKRDVERGEVRVLEEDDRVIKEAVSLLPTTDLTISIGEDFERLEELQSEDQQLAAQANFLNDQKRDQLPSERSEARDKLKELLTDIDAMRVTFNEIATTLINDYGYIEADIRPLIDEFDEIVSEFQRADTLSLERWQTFYEDRLSKFLKKLSGRKTRGNPVLTDRINRIKEISKRVEKNRDANKNFQETLQEIRDVKSQFKQIGSSHVEVEKDIRNCIGKVIDKFNSIVPNVQSLNRPEVAIIVPGITTDCDDYLDKFVELTEKDPDTLSEEDLRTFVNDVYNPFLAKVREKITNSSAAKAQELEQKRREITELDEKIARQTGTSGRLANGTVAEFLQRAFSGIKVDGDTVKIRGFEANFKHVAQLLKAAQTYFESPDEIGKLRDSHKDLNNLIKKSSDQKFTDELSSSDVGFTKEDFDKGIQAQINKLEAKIDAIKRSTVQDQKNATEDQRRANEKIREARAEKVARLSEALRVLKDNLEAAKLLHGAMQKLIKQLEVAEKAGVISKINGKDLKDIIDEFNKIDLRGTDFQPKQLLGIYEDFGNYFESDTNVANLASEIEKAQKEIASSTNLTDAQAGKKIIAAIIAEQYPNMSLEDQQKMAAAILADDVEKIQVQKGYEDLAKEGGADKLEIANQAGVRAKLIGFRYKEGEKNVQPFRGLKPENFKDWASIEQLFKIGKLNYQNGFFVLVAFKEFEKQNGVTASIESSRIEKKIKTLLAEQLGVEKRMDEAGINRIVNEAFDDQMKKARPLVEEYFAHYEANKSLWNANKVQELKLRIQRLKEELRLDKISKEIYSDRYAKIIEEAEEFEISDQAEFSRDSITASFWDSKKAQWLRDRGVDIGHYLRGKAGRVAMSGLKLAGAGAFGTVKLGTSLAYQTAMTPLRIAKYPLMLAIKPIVGFINLFRKSKWTPLPTIRESLRNDAGRVVGYFKAKGTSIAEGTTKNLSEIPKGEWEKTKYEATEYAKRTKVNLETLEAEAKEHKERGEATPVEISESPFISLDKYKKEIEELDRIVQGEAAKKTA